MNIWVLSTGSLDDGGVAQIIGAFTTKELAFDAFVKACDTFGTITVPSICTNDTEIYADNTLDYVQLLLVDVTSQKAIG